YKVLGIIVAGVIVFQYFNSTYGKTNGNLDLFQAIVTVAVGISSFSAFLVARKYWDYSVFGKAYLSLGIGLACFALGDIIWYYYTEILNQYPYPSFADIPYFALYPFMIYHILKNGRSFQKEIKTHTKIWLCVIPVTILLTYVYSSNKAGSEPFDFWYGMIFVAITSITLAFSIYGFQIFRKSILGNVWGLLLAGISLFTIADVWYYHLEVFNQFTDNHPVTAAWLLGTLVIMYSLYLHKNAI
ncbi:MAG: hypothetical protein ACREA5_01505, partial [Nitrosotalea sp.]